MDLLDLIDEIARHRPFRPETVGELTGHRLTPGRANPYYTMHRSTEAGIPFASVEVRSPTAQNPAAGFVCLEVLGSRLTRADVGDRWGKGQGAVDRSAPSRCAGRSPELSRVPATLGDAAARVLGGHRPAGDRGARRHPLISSGGR